MNVRLPEPFTFLTTFVGAAATMLAITYIVSFVKGTSTAQASRYQWHERLVFDGGFLAVLIDSRFRAGENFNCLLPCACGNAFVGTGQIRLGHLQVEHGWRSELFLDFTTALTCAYVCLRKNHCPLKANDSMAKI
jgi:hypothetical protein